MEGEKKKLVEEIEEKGGEEGWGKLGKRGEKGLEEEMREELVLFTPQGGRRGD